MSNNQKNPRISETVVVFLESHPKARMGEIQEYVLGHGLSTEQGIQSVMRNLVRDGVVIADTSTDKKKFRYSLAPDAPAVRRTDSALFAVPVELAGPIVPPLVWSMRHLLGHAA